MQIKEGKKGIYTNKIYSKFKRKKTRKIRVNCKSGTIKKCNKQNGKIKTMPGLYEKQGAVYVKNK